MRAKCPKPVMQAAKVKFVLQPVHDNLAGRVQCLIVRKCFARSRALSGFDADKVKILSSCSKTRTQGRLRELGRKVSRITEDC